ncbi:MAG: hypothetical protein ABL925_02350 [Methylococcales bacterium]
MKKILLSLLAVVLIVEEWLWDWLTVLGHWLAGRLNLVKIEQWLVQTTPRMALFAFCIPLLIVTPINLIALGLLASGLILQGLLLELMAKLLGTLLIARVFALTKPQLLSFAFLNYIYTTISSWLHWAHQQITETVVYRMAQRLKAEAKKRLATWFKTV